MHVPKIPDCPIRPVLTTLPDFDVGTSYDKNQEEVIITLHAAKMAGFDKQPLTRSFLMLGNEINFPQKISFFMTFNTVTSDYVSLPELLLQDRSVAKVNA